MAGGRAQVKQEGACCPRFIADAMVPHGHLPSIGRDACEVEIAFGQGTIWPKSTGLGVEFRGLALPFSTPSVR
jgi:hypothetical protein